MEQAVNDVIVQAIRDVLRTRELGACLLVHDQRTALLVIQTDPGALTIHQSTVELENRTGLAATIRTWSSLNPGEQSRLDNIGLLLN